jgi:hypothetical protein
MADRGWTVAWQGIESASEPAASGLRDRRRHRRRHEPCRVRARDRGRKRDVDLQACYLTGRAEEWIKLDLDYPDWVKPPMRPTPATTTGRTGMTATTLLRRPRLPNQAHNYSFRVGAWKFIAFNSMAAGDPDPGQAYHGIRRPLHPRSLAPHALAQSGHSPWTLSNTQWPMRASTDT